MRWPVATCVIAGMAAACGGGEGESPRIASFSAEPATVQAGGTVRLTGHFSGGAGFVDPGPGLVVSGQPAEVVVADDTSYTLSVTGNGETARATAAVTVVYDRAWEFDDALGWELGVARVQDGVLLLQVTISAETSPYFPPSQGCAGAFATATYGDAKLAAGRYSTLRYEFRGVSTRSTESGLSSLNRILVRYRGQQFEFPPSEATSTLRVEWALAANPKLFVDGVFSRDLTVTPTIEPTGIAIIMRLCPRPWPEPGGSSYLTVDAIAVSAR